MRDELSPWVARGLYLFGLALMLHASIDLFSTVWPMRWTELAWRYGFLGLAAGYLQTPTLGLLFIAGTAIWQDDARVVRAVGVVFMVCAVILLGIIGVFGLDVLAMRDLRAPEARSGVLVGGVLQEVKYSVATVVFVLLGHGFSKTAKRMASAAARVTKKHGIVSTG